MLDFDYYQIKGKWNAATLNRRAEKLEEAQAAADELEEAGAKGVEIIGVKAGKRETIRGKKKATKAAKTPKAKKAPAKKKKAAQDAKIKILKKETPKRETAGQLDLFDVEKKNIWRFNNREINYIKKSLYEQFETGRSIYGLKNLLTNFEKLNARQKIELTNIEITRIYECLLNYRFKHNIGATGPTFFEISRLMETLKNGV